MKVEKIYEIPVNDAFDENCECALCFLESRLETKNLDFCLGPAMMKPEFRTETNKKGFCRRHLIKMLEYRNRLPMALVMDTHIASVNEIFNKKKCLKKQYDTDFIIEQLDILENSCAVCDLINETFDKYLNVILYMWCNDNEFRIKFENSKGFCISHFTYLLKKAKKELSGKEFAAFSKTLIDIQKREMSRIKDDINWFTKKFDYKNKDADWKSSKDAPRRTASKLRKYTV